jgi:hypothetical protein
VRHSVVPPLDNLPTTKRDAILTGSKLFYSGRPCLKAHQAPCYVVSGRCMVCQLQSNDAGYRRNRLAAAAASASSASSCALRRTR